VRPVISLRAVAAYIFATGLAAGLAQVVLLRELLVIATGTELVIGLLLAIWLVGGALGSLWAERGAPHPRAQARRAAQLAWLGGPALAAGVLVIRLARPFLSSVPNALAACFPATSKMAYLLGRVVAVQPGEALGLAHIVLLALLATLPAAFFCGGAFVTGARLLRPAAGAGHAYALDALGHLLGGVALALAITVWLDGLWVAAAVTPVLVAAAWSVLPEPKEREARISWVGAVLLALPMVLVSGPARRWRWPGQAVLAERASIFGLVTVAAQQGGGAYFFENGVPAGASPPTPHMEVLVNFALAQVPQPRRILLIGGGTSGGVAECLKHKPERVDYVEFDPVFLALGRRWAAEADRRALADRRVRCWAADPRLVLRFAPASYDAIVVALAVPTTALLNRFFTREWFAACRRALRGPGVVAFSLPYSQVYRSELLGQLDRCVVQAAASLAPHAALALLAGDDLTVVVPLGPGQHALVLTPQAVLARLRQRGVDAPYLQALVWDWLSEQNVRQARELLAGPALPNTDLRPLGYLLGTIYWLAQVTPTAGVALCRLLRWPPGIWPLVLLLLVSPALVMAALLPVAPRRLRRLGAWVYMATAGWAGMAMQMGVIFLLQSWHGYVYGFIGAVTGAFMIGAALGAVAREPARLARLARAWLAAVTLASAVLLLAHVSRPDTTIPAWGFPLLAACAGSLVGYAFPQAVRLWGGSSGRGLGVIYAADLVGGVLAALLVPGLLIPLAGLGLSVLFPAVALGALLCACRLLR
jgi:spermidine synthase